MKLYLKGHTDLYPVEQLQMQLFPGETSEQVFTPFEDEKYASFLTIAILHLCNYFQI